MTQALNNNYVSNASIQVHAQALLQKHGVRPNDPRAKVLLELAAELEPKEVKANFSGKLELKEGLSRGGKYRYEYRGDEFTIVIYSKKLLAKGSAVAGRV